MKKTYSAEQIKTIIGSMQADERFRGRRNDFILQQGRLSRIEKEGANQTISDEDRIVELNRIFFALQALAGTVGITNFLEFIELSETVN